MSSKIELLKPDERGRINHVQGRPPLTVRLRWWLIRKIAGRMPVILNLEVRPHTEAECEYSTRVMDCEHGLFRVIPKCRNDYGITFRQADTRHDQR